jgi:hypothetical protein
MSILQYTKDTVDIAGKCCGSGLFLSGSDFSNPGQYNSVCANAPERYIIAITQG